MDLDLLLVIKKGMKFMHGGLRWSWMFERFARFEIQKFFVEGVGAERFVGRADNAIGPQMKNLVSNLDLPIRSTNSSSSPVICY